MTFKKLFTISALTLSMQMAFAAPVQFVDRIVAVVENQVITMNEFQGELAQAKMRAPKGQAPTEQDVLLSIVDQALLKTVAERNGIEVSDADIDNAIAELAKGNKMTNEQVYKKVGQESGLSRAGVRRVMADRVLVNKVTEREVYSRVQVSDAEINSLIASGQVQLPAGPIPKITQYDTKHILISINQETPAPMALKKIEEIQARLKAGEAFDSLARTYSQDPGSAAQGGSLGWVSKGVTVPEFEKVMVSLPSNVVSQPIRSVFGYHLIKVDGKRDHEDKDALLHEQAKQMITQQRAGQVYQEMMQQLRKDAHIEVRM